MMRPGQPVVFTFPHEDRLPVRIRKRCREAYAESKCAMIVGLVVAFLLFDSVVVPALNRAAPRAVPVSGGAAASLVRLVSARLAGGAGDDAPDANLSEEANRLLATTSKSVANLTPCASGKCAESDPSDEEREAHLQAVTRFLEQGGEAFVMYYAPWCPHCHSMMPSFLRAAAKAGKPAGLVNAELVPRDALQGGEGSVCDVQHFPFVVVQKGSQVKRVYKGAPSDKKLEAFAQASSAAAAAEEEKEEAVDDPLVQLFK